MKELISGAITSPLGFKTNAIACGLKKSKNDLALIYSIVRAQAAAVFTTNKVKAAPLIVGKRSLRGNRAQAVVVNSGNANCCTGVRGIRDAGKVIGALARCLKIPAQEIVMSSTGVIGKFLPVEKIIPALPALVAGLGFDKAQLTAQAIMTTDTFPKQLAVAITIGGKRVMIGAVAKGAGMICPDMATMLCFITTDANISVPALKKALKQAVDASFNRISVDGEMSTNDTALILANGLAENARIESGAVLDHFTAALTHVCVRLAKMMVEDGEGATKVMQISVEGAASKIEAKRAAGRIANSLLVKTMISGCNPNWGRIPACLGAAGIRLNEKKLEIFLQKKAVYRNELPVAIDRDRLIALLGEKYIAITARLHKGNFSYSMWASDLTAEYVRINTEYN